MSVAPSARPRDRHYRQPDFHDLCPTGGQGDHRSNRVTDEGIDVLNCNKNSRADDADRADKPPPTQNAGKKGKREKENEKQKKEKKRNGAHPGRLDVSSGSLRVQSPCKLGLSAV